MRNYEMEQKIIELCESYRSKLPQRERGWLAIAATVDLSRNAIYDIFNSEKKVRRDSVILLGLALEMNLKDFNTLFNFKGFFLRPYINRDAIIIKYFENNNFDHESLGNELNDNGEDPPFNYTKPIR